MFCFVEECVGKYNAIRVLVLEGEVELLLGFGSDEVEGLSGLEHAAEEESVVRVGVDLDEVEDDVFGELVVGYRSRSPVLVVHDFVLFGRRVDFLGCLFAILSRFHFLEERQVFLFGVDGGVSVLGLNPGRRTLGGIIISPMG